MTDMLSPASQMDGNAEPTLTAANGVLVDADVGIQSKEQEEAVGEEPARANPLRKEPTPGGNADDNPDEKPAPAERLAMDVELNGAADENSHFAPLNPEENTTSARSNGNEPEDEIVVGSRAKKTAALGLEMPRVAAENINTKASTNDTTDDEPRVRLSKRKRNTVRYSSKDDGEGEEEEYAPSSRSARKPLNSRGIKEKTTEAQSYISTGGEEPVTRTNKTPKVSKNPVVPLDAPLRPATRHPRKKRRPNQKNNYNSNNNDISPTTSAINTSDDDMDPFAQSEQASTHKAMGPPPPKQEAEAPSAADKTRILLGYWKHSSEEDPVKKHAIVAVLGTNKQLRPRLLKEDRYGNTVIGNHPPGAGGVWRNWDEIEFEPHIRHLTRAQLKEYVSIRMEQKETGETPQAQEANQIKAVKQAEDSVEAAGQPSVADFVQPAVTQKRALDAPATPDAEAAVAKDVAAPEVKATPASPAHKRPRSRLSSVKSAKGSKRTPTLEEINARAQHHVAAAEVIQQRRTSQRASSAAAAATATATASTPAPASATASPTLSNSVNPNPNRRILDQALGGMQRNWAAQAEQAARDGVDNAKVYLGNRFEYQKDGFFEGLYATTSTIIKIGNEEFVENRVLRRVGR